MSPKYIETTAEYEEILAKVEDLFNKSVKKGTPEGNELEAFLLMLEKYEDEHFPIDLPNREELIKYRIEQKTIKKT